MMQLPCCHCHMVYQYHFVGKCPPDAHFRIPMEVVSHLGTFYLLFYEHEHTDIIV